MRNADIGPDGWLARGANNLNALRLLAAIGVVVSHCVLLRAGLGHEAAEPLAGVNYFNLGDHALNVFFFISGLTVTASLARSRSIGDFLVARVLRIWPGLFAVVLVTVLLVAPIASSVPIGAYFGDPAWARMIAKTFALSGPMGSLPGLFDTNPLPHVVNGSPWTLRYEVICYVILLTGTLAAARLGPRARGSWVVITTLATGLAIVAVPPGVDATAADHLLRFWFAFGLGALAYQGRALFDHFIARAAPLAAVSTSVFVASIGTRYECVAAIVATGAMILLAARVPIFSVRRFTNRFDLSYGIYITTWPITQLLVAWLPDLPFGAMLMLVLLSSACLAFGSWMLIEQPAMALRPGASRIADATIGRLVGQGAASLKRRMRTPLGHDLSRG